MPLKRASRGRRKGGKGSSGVVQCTNCGQTVPKDKAKKVTSRLNLVCGLTLTLIIRSPLTPSGTDSPSPDIT